MTRPGSSPPPVAVRSLDVARARWTRRLHRLRRYLEQQYHQRAPSQPRPPHRGDLRLLERRMLVLINRDRARFAEEARHAQPLQWDEGAAAVARQHSHDMVRRHFMAHVNPDGLDPFQRLRRAGIRFVAAGENIAGGPTTGRSTGYPSVEQAQAALMDEPRYTANHRGNILSPVFTHVGIGIVQNVDGSLVITQAFVGR